VKVIVYVEGPSDEVAMRECLKPLLEEKSAQGIAIDFAESPRGNKKKTLLTKVPKLAVNILLNEPEALVVVVPDLYPDCVFSHRTFEELRAGIICNFEEALRDKGIDDKRFLNRFRVFCFKGRSRSSRAGS
jgi:hypothetical protein